MNNSTASVSGMIERDNSLDSLGEKLGEFKAYDSQLPLADIKGTRVVKCLYQVNKATGKKVAENSYCRVPNKHLGEDVIVARIADLAPYVSDWLASLEDAAIKEEHKKGGLRIYTEGLSIDKIIEGLEASSETGRLNKEKVEAWFDASLAESLIPLFAEKLGLDLEASEITEDMEKKIGKLDLIIAAYKAKFASLASPKVYIKEADCEAMVKVIVEAGAKDSFIGARFIARLEKMSEKEDDLLLSL